MKNNKLSNSDQMIMKITDCTIGVKQNNEVINNCKIKSEMTGEETADWVKSIKEAKVRIGLQCHGRKKKEEGGGGGGGEGGGEGGGGGGEEEEEEEEER